MKQLTRKQALQVTIGNEVPDEHLRKPEHALVLTCISCIGSGVVRVTGVERMRAMSEVYANDYVEWYWTPIGYVCGGCASDVLGISEDEDTEDEKD